MEDEKDSEQLELAAQVLKDHIELFQNLLMKARELENELPSIGPPSDTLATIFVYIARLLASAHKHNIPYDVGGLILMHIDNCSQALERFEEKKKAGLPTEPIMN